MRNKFERDFSLLWYLFEWRLQKSNGVINNIVSETSQTFDFLYDPSKASSPTSEFYDIGSAETEHERGSLASSSGKSMIIKV